MTTLTALPIAPSRADPTNFSARGDAMMTALETVFVPQMNTVIGEINVIQADVASKASTATTQAAIATTQAVAAAAAASAAGATVWVSGTTYAINDARFSPLDKFTYRRLTSGAGTTDPSLDATNWKLISNVYPDQTGKNGKVLVTKNNIVTFTDYVHSNIESFDTTISANYTIPVGTNMLLVSSNSGTTGVITLPDPSTYNNLEKILIVSGGTNSPAHIIRSSSNEHLGKLPGSGINGQILLTNNASSSWSINNPSARISNQIGTGLSATTSSYARVTSYINRYAIACYDGSATYKLQTGSFTTPRTILAAGTEITTAIDTNTSTGFTPVIMSDTLILLFGASVNPSCYPRVASYTVNTSTNALTLGNTTQWDATNNTIYGPVGMSRITATTALIIYGDGNAMEVRASVFTTNATGSVLTPGTRFSMSSVSGLPTYTAGNHTCITLTSTLALHLASAGTGNNIYATAIGVSGTNLTFSSTAVVGFTSAGLSSLTYDAVALDSTRVLVVYKNSGDSNYFSAIVLTLSGTSNVVAGTPLRIVAASTGGCAVYLKSDGKVYVACGSSIYKLTVSGSTITTDTTYSSSIPVAIPDQSSQGRGIEGIKLSASGVYFLTTPSSITSGSLNLQEVAT